jgi:hypothetical protein
MWSTILTIGTICCSGWLLLSLLVWAVFFMPFPNED